MKPDIELVSIAGHESFKAFAHGYPYRTVRWHYHPEYEIHLVTSTQGRYFIGDFIGHFEPGNLVMIGPNVPHNWISDVPVGSRVEKRNIVVQFSAEHITRLLGAMPELKSLHPLLDRTRLGLKFSDSTAERALTVMTAICSANGPHRASLFLQLIELLADDTHAQTLASAALETSPDNPAHAGINSVLAYLQRNYSAPLRESELAALCNRSASSFSRAFIRATGMPFVEYLNRLRVRAACDLLTESELNITDICFKAGFSSISNFNRRFSALKSMSPRQYRSSFAAGLRSLGDAEDSLRTDRREAAVQGHARLAAPPAPG